MANQKKKISPPFAEILLICFCIIVSSAVTASIMFRSRTYLGSISDGFSFGLTIGFLLSVLWAVIYVISCFFAVNQENALLRKHTLKATILSIGVGSFYSFIWIELSGF